VSVWDFGRVHFPPPLPPSRTSPYTSWWPHKFCFFDIWILTAHSFPRSRRVRTLYRCCAPLPLKFVQRFPLKCRLQCSIHKNFRKMFRRPRLIHLFSRASTCSHGRPSSARNSFSAFPISRSSSAVIMFPARVLQRLVRRHQNRFRLGSCLDHLALGQMSCSAKSIDSSSIRSISRVQRAR